VDQAEKGGKQAQKRLPCRITIKVSGVEAFMYNRSPAYDSIIEAVRRKANSVPDQGRETSGAHAFIGDSAVTSSVDDEKIRQDDRKARKTHTQEDGVSRAATRQSVPPAAKPDPLPSFLRLLPVNIDCNKGAIVIGNEHTASVITAKFDKASGDFDAAKTGPLDVYQQVFNFNFTHPVVHMKPNPDFKAPQLEFAAHLKQEAAEGLPDEELDEKSDQPKKRLNWIAGLPRLSGLFSKSTDSIRTNPKSSTAKKKKNHVAPVQFPGEERWKGLTRYLDDSQDNGHSEWDDVEYAKTALIMDCPRIDVRFYWDVTGKVPSELDNSVHVDPSRPNDINGSIPPEYGLDVQVYGGTINYGPWTDRHRAIFQSIYFPGSHVDASPASPLSAGDPRVLSVFKLYLSIEADTVLRIPVREPSKDWKWKGKAHALAGREKQKNEKAKVKTRSRRRPKQRDTTTPGTTGRPFGWIDIKIAGNSSVNYVMDMVASERGFQSKLDVDVVNSEISSSVNHGVLWRSGQIGLDCDLSTPLGWNSLRKWLFNISCQDLELFLLRDHLFLLTDLVADWGSGPGSDYYSFVPFQYLLKIDFRNFKLYLNTNESNIVNNPADLDDNNFIILYGQSLYGDVTIPLDRFRPQQYEIRFDIRGHGMGLELRMPSRNTLKAFVRHNNVATLSSLVLTGSHTYMTETSPMNTDRLFMDIQGSVLSFELYGWLVHHFMKIKDNYFGDDMHFKTLEEYQGLPSQNVATDGTVPNAQHTKVSSDLDVILSISAEQGSVLLPSNLYSAENFLRADIPYMSADLRFTNYYMDLMVNFSPISLSLGNSIASPEQPKAGSGQTEIFVDSVAISGHRLFGLPPTEPTYVCNWDFDIGNISGECSPDFIEKAVGTARSFAFTLDDPENSLTVTTPVIIHDATFLRLKTEDIRLWLHVASEAVLISSGPITLNFNDLADFMFSQRLNASISDLRIGMVDAKSAHRRRTRTFEKHVVETHAFLQTDLKLNMLGRKQNFSNERRKQQAHIQQHDQRTHRTPFLLLHDESSLYAPGEHQDNIRAPAMQFPGLPEQRLAHQPTDHGSSISSGYLSDDRSVRGRQLRPSFYRTASTVSLANSIRSGHRYTQVNRNAMSSHSGTLFDRSRSLTDDAKRGYRWPPEDEMMRRNLPPTSVAYSSSLAMPYFPLDHIELDLTDVPSFPAVSPDLNDIDEDAVVFNDVLTNRLDESFDHTSLIITSEPGIRVHCTPEAIRCVSNLLRLILPHHPEDILDDFQVQVLNKILDNEKRREGKGKSVDFSVRIPFVHVRFQNKFGPDMGPASGKDQYDIILNQLKLALRTRRFPVDESHEDTLAFHTMLGSLGISVTEKTLQGPSDHVAVQAELRDLLVWMLKAKETSANISFRTLEAATASSKVTYLASLIHRTALLSKQLVTRFEEVIEVNRLRLRYLALFLTNVQQRFPDPPFLTKASYALRTAKDHLRTHDSWKIISRFRYIWRSLPEAEKTELLRHCSQESVACPNGAEEHIIAKWDQWRTWDLAHVKKSLAMKVLFGCPTADVPVSSAVPLSMDIRSHAVRLIIDPGPNQSDASLLNLALNIAVVPPPQPTGLMLVSNDIRKRSTVVQFNTRETSIRLRWEICDLIEALIANFKQDEVQLKRSETFPSAARKKIEEHDLQFVYVSEKAEVSLDTINLRGHTVGQRLRFSLAMSDKHASGEDEIITALLHLEQGVIQLHSRSRSLFRSQHDHPTLYFAQQKDAGNTPNPPKIKVAGTSRMIKVHVEEDILGFIELMDLVLRDEVTYLRRPANALQKSVQQKPERLEVDATTAQLPHITLALFMDSYLIELALLQSLTWTISGTSGRISVVPSLGHDVTLKVDYDLAAHTHRLVSRSARSSDTISTLVLPPLNGRLAVASAEKEFRVSASGIIETIQVQASEVQALIATVNKPEFLSVVHAIQEDIEVFKSHIQETFPKAGRQDVVQKPKSSRDIVFDIGMTLSGLVVLASAPGKLPNSATANLAIKIGSVQVKATNIGPDMARLSLPEAVAHLGEMSVEMTLSDSETVRHCGNLSFGATFHVTAQEDSDGPRRMYSFKSTGLEVNIFADTASAVVDVMNHLQDKIRDLDLSREKKYLRRLRHTKSRISPKKNTGDTGSEGSSTNSNALFGASYSVEFLKIQVSWIVGTSIPPYPRTETEDLVLSFRRINFYSRKGDTARLMIEDLQLQMVPVSNQKDERSLNSALLPEIVFHVAYASAKDTRNIAFQAAGKSLDLRLDSRFILPANIIERSIALASKKLRTASANWSVTPTTSGAQRKNPFGNKRLTSLLVSANFAGAVVHINGGAAASTPGKRESRSQQRGRYSQFVGDESKSSMVLKAPGIALKVEYNDDGHDPSLNAELKIDGSSNTLYPTVVPLLIDISESVKEVVREKDEKSPDTDTASPQASTSVAKLVEDDSLITADPSTILGRTRLNLGLRICKQEFSLSCQPIARVAAIAKLEDIYVTVNSVKSQEHGHFFAVSAAFQKLQAKVQHVYSRESTFGFDVDSVVLSMMNSKHLSGTSGISAILKFNPIGLQINARQLQDFLLFREIWLPPEIRQQSKPSTGNVSQGQQDYLIQRYKQVTAATAFPWNANVAIADVSVELDLGQAIGKTSLHIHNLWASSRKSTDWEQNMCIGVEKVGLESTGRTSGFVELQGVKVRTSISWPSQALGIRQTPLVQASLGFNQLRVKAGFDYQAFLIADIANFNFLMYNVREQVKGGSDRLVAVLDGDKVRVCCTATSAAQGLALWQAIERLIQDNQEAYTRSLKDIEKFLRRKSSTSAPFGRSASESTIIAKPADNNFKIPVSLHTDVVVTLRSISLGVFPSTFIDTQIFSIDASDVQARFAVAMDQGKIHSGLGMTLGKLSVALSNIPSPKHAIPISDLTVEDVLESAKSARGGIILRVPKVIATMHTWQVPKSEEIDYIFQSHLEGKVDVGWNYSRISYIRTMWSNHSRSLASRLGKPLPEGNIKITSSSPPEEQQGQPPASTSTSTSNEDRKNKDKAKDKLSSNSQQEKITAEIKVPQSRYTYRALEPPVIETPQLRDMGEATPPLEWIGLHRDRLPNVTHQIVIVTLLEVAREVEEAYTRILGSS
jgi:hypothetical protein